MTTPLLIPLTGHKSLAFQVAEQLLDDVPGRPPDLGSTLVWTSTAGAARKIRKALAVIASSKGTGVLSPVFTQPMASLLTSTQTASRTDREVAWGIALGCSDPSTMQALFPRKEVLEGEQMRLGTAGMLCDLCDLLAEGGVVPNDPRLGEVCREDSDRWSELHPIYSRYLDELRRVGLEDPNEAKIRGIDAPRGEISRLVVACIPDLPFLATERAISLMEQGVEVKVLIWKPGVMNAGFDAWGRPKPEDWAKASIPITENQLRMAKDPADEASKSLDYLSNAGGDHAVVICDPDLSPAFQSEVLRRGGSPFLPDGRPLAGEEAAVVAAGWVSLKRERRLRNLARLLESPRFAAWIAAKAGITPDRALAACAGLRVDLIAETIDQAAAFLESRGGAPDDEDALIGALNSVMAVSLGTLVREAWPELPEAAREVLKAWEETGSSKLLSRWPEARETAFLRSVARGRIFSSSSSGDTELLGWLEAPWVQASHLALCGCREGRVPASTDPHPFLPDSRRGILGIADNASRTARDAYLLHCLVSAREHDGLMCSFSKFGPDGSPSIPSTLLLRCADNELPGRVLMLFAKPEGYIARPRRSVEWRWNLPQISCADVSKISATDFKAYLQCPLRFYLNRMLKLSDVNPEIREMDALRFGSLIHIALERFARQTPHEGEEERIKASVLFHLNAAVTELFGSDPSPAVRVQVEAAKVRLISFARVQAEEFEKGWRILEVERKIEAVESIKIGPLTLSAKIDRIEENGDSIRIIDYKTQGGVKSPDETHFGPLSAGFLDEAEVRVAGKPRRWIDLQLPLYRRIAEGLFPGRDVQTAYFVLAADPEESRVLELDLDEEKMDSALRCAEVVSDLVSNGVFWPPQPLPGGWSDPYAGLFLNGNPDECFDQETLTFLKRKQVREARKEGRREG